MADELQLVTTNAADDGWIDGVPGAVSTGYQAQNTVLQALFNGLDKSSVRIDGAFLKIDPSGVIDDSGLPFVVQSAITLALPTTGATNWFLKVVAGSTALERSIEFTDDRGTYDAAKNGFYNTGGERVLNWCYNRLCGRLERIGDVKTAAEITFASKVVIGLGAVFNYASGITKINVFGAVATDVLSEFSSPTFTAKGNGVRHISVVLKDVNVNTSDKGFLYIYKNSTLIAGGVILDAYSAVSSGVSASIYLEDGDTIEFYFRADNSASIYVSSVHIYGEDSL